MATTPSHIIIQDAQVSDAAAIATILKETWSTTYPNSAYGISFNDITAHLERFTPETIANRIDNQQELNRHYWIAIYNDKLAGVCCALKDDQNQVYSILSLYVRPAYQNLGIGSALLTTALQWIGSHDVELGVAEYNRRAIDFYTFHGFTIIGPRHDEIANLPSGKVIPEITMIKKV